MMMKEIMRKLAPQCLGQGKRVKAIGSAKSWTVRRIRSSSHRMMVKWRCWISCGNEEDGSGKEEYVSSIRTKTEKANGERKEESTSGSTSEPSDNEESAVSSNVAVVKGKRATDIRIVKVDRDRGKKGKKGARSTFQRF